MEKEKRSRLPLFGNFRRRGSGEKQCEVKTRCSSLDQEGSENGSSSPRIRHKSGSPFRSHAVPSSPVNMSVSKKSSTLPVAKAERILHEGGTGSGIASRSLPTFMASPTMPRYRAPGVPVLSGMTSPRLGRWTPHITPPRTASGQAMAEDTEEGDYAEIWVNDDEVDTGGPVKGAECHLSAAEHTSKWSHSIAPIVSQPTVTAKVTPLDTARWNKSLSEVSQVDRQAGNSSLSAEVITSSSDSPEGVGTPGHSYHKASSVAGCENNVNNNTKVTCSTMPTHPQSNRHNLGDNGTAACRPVVSPVSQEEHLDDSHLSDDHRGSRSSPVSRLGVGRAYSRPSCGVRMAEMRAATKRLYCISPPTIEEESDNPNIADHMGPSPTHQRYTTPSPQCRRRCSPSPQCRSPTSLDLHLQRAYSYPEESLEPDIPTSHYHSGTTAMSKSNNTRLGHPPTPTSPRKNIYQGQRQTNKTLQHSPLSSRQSSPQGMTTTSSGKGRPLKSKSCSPNIGRSKRGQFDGQRPKVGDLELSDSEIEMTSYGLSDSSCRASSGGNRYGRVNHGAGKEAKSTGASQNMHIPQQCRHTESVDSSAQQPDRCDRLKQYIHTGGPTNSTAATNTTDSLVRTGSSTTLQAVVSSQPNLSEEYRKQESDATSGVLDSTTIERNMATNVKTSTTLKCDASAQAGGSRIGGANVSNRRRYRGGVVTRSRLRPPTAGQSSQDHKDIGPRDVGSPPVSPHACGQDQIIQTHTGRISNSYGRQAGRTGIDRVVRGPQNDINTSMCSRHPTKPHSIEVPIIAGNSSNKCSNDRLSSGVKDTKPSANKNRSSQLQHRNPTQDIDRPHHRKPRHSNLDKKYNRSVLGSKSGSANKIGYSRGHTSDTEEYSGSCESSTENLTKLGKYSHARHGGRSKGPSTSPYRDNDLELSSELSSSVSSIASTSSGTTSLPSPSRGKSVTKGSHTNKDNKESNKVDNFVPDKSNVMLETGEITMIKNSSTETRTSDTGYSDSSYNGTHRESTPETGFSSIEEPIVEAAAEPRNDVPRRMIGLARANSVPAKTSSIPKSQVPQLPRRTHSLGAQRPGSKIGLPKSSINFSQRDVLPRGSSDIAGSVKPTPVSGMQARCGAPTQVMRPHMQTSIPPVSPRSTKSKVSPPSPSTTNRTSSSLVMSSRTASRSKLDINGSRSNLAGGTSKSKLITSSRSNLSNAPSKSKLDGSSKTNLSIKQNENQGKPVTKSRTPTSNTDIPGIRNPSMLGAQCNNQRSTLNITTSVGSFQRQSGLRKPIAHRRDNSNSNIVPSKLNHKSLSRESSVDSTADKEDSPQRKRSTQKPPLPPRTSSLRTSPGSEIQKGHSVKDAISKFEPTSPPPVAAKPSFSKLSKLKPPGSRSPLTSEQKSKVAVPKTVHTSAQMHTSVTPKCEVVEIQHSVSTCQVMDLHTKNTEVKSNSGSISTTTSGSQIHGISSFGSQSKLRKPYNSRRYGSNIAHRFGADKPKTKAKVSSQDCSYNNTDTTICNTSNVADANNLQLAHSTQDNSNTLICDNMPSNSFINPSQSNATDSFMSGPIDSSNQSLQQEKPTSETMSVADTNKIKKKDSYTTSYDGDQILVIECQPKEAVLNNTLSEVTKKDHQRGLKLSENTKQIKTENSVMLCKDVNTDEENVGIEIETIEVRSYIEVYHNGNVVSRKMSNGQPMLCETTDNGENTEHVNSVHKEKDAKAENELVEIKVADVLSGRDEQAHADSPVCDSGIMSESSEESNHAGSDDGQTKVQTNTQRSSLESADNQSLLSCSDEGVTPTSLSLSVSSTLDENRNLAGEAKTETQLVEEYISKSGLLDSAGDSDQSESGDNAGDSDGTLTGSDEERKKRVGRKAEVNVVAPPMEVCSAATTPDTEYGKSFPGQDDLKHYHSLDGKTFVQQSMATKDKQAVNMEFIMKHGISLDSGSVATTPVEDDNDNKAVSDETIKADDEYQLELLTDMCEEYISVTHIQQGRTLIMNTDDNKGSKFNTPPSLKPIPGDHATPFDMHSLEEAVMIGIFGEAKRTKGRKQRQVLPRPGDRDSKGDSDSGETTINKANLMADSPVKGHMDNIVIPVQKDKQDQLIIDDLTMSSGDRAEHSENRPDQTSRHSNEDCKGEILNIESAHENSVIDLVSDDDMLDDMDDNKKVMFFVTSDPYEDLCDESLEAWKDKIHDKSYDSLDAPDSPSVKVMPSTKNNLGPEYGSPSRDSVSGPAPLRSASSPNLQKGRGVSHSDTEGDGLLLGGSPLKRAAATSHLNIEEEDDTLLIVDVATSSQKLVSQMTVSENSIHTSILYQMEGKEREFRCTSGEDSPVDTGKEKEVTQAAARLREFLEHSISESTNTDSDDVDSARDKKTSKDAQEENTKVVETPHTDSSPTKPGDKPTCDPGKKDEIRDDHKQKGTHVSKMKSPLKVNVAKASDRHSSPQKSPVRRSPHSSIPRSPQSPSHKPPVSSPSDTSPKCRIPKPRAFGSRIPTVGDMKSPSFVAPVADAGQPAIRTPCIVDVSVVKQRESLTSPRIDEGYGTLRGSEKVGIYIFLNQIISIIDTLLKTQHKLITFMSCLTFLLYFIV